MNCPKLVFIYVPTLVRSSNINIENHDHYQSILGGRINKLE